jgi:NADPH2:quinone reductase
VRVLVSATSVNMVDTKIRTGLPIGPALPAILGCDLAGIVEAIGDGVTSFRTGDAVFGCTGGVRGQGLGKCCELALVIDGSGRR